MANWLRHIRRMLTIERQKNLRLHIFAHVSAEVGHENNSIGNENMQLWLGSPCGWMPHIVAKMTGVVRMRTTN